MKLKITEMMILLVLSFSSIAQPYQSIFYSDTTRWTVGEYVIDLDYTNEFTTFTDTMINDLLHKKLYVANGCYPEKIVENSYLREDTLTGKVWHVIKNDNKWKEFLIMDLSLSKRDTFLFYTNFYRNEVDTLVVDTIYYDEEERKIVGCDAKYTWRDHKVLFIEGIGPSAGFCRQDASPDIMGLRCKFHNQEHIYTFTSEFEGDDDCYSYCADSFEETKIGSFYKIKKVSSGQVNIFINDPQKNICLFVYNQQGQIVNSYQLYAGDNSVQLGLKGIFILKLNDGENTVSVKILL